jgi:predicted  nucleic acid-binding Zn-ribbon protein
MRLQCANCGYVFDWLDELTETNCPRCKSNAVGNITNENGSTEFIKRLLPYPKE